MEKQLNPSDLSASEQVIQLVLSMWTSRNTAVTNFFNKHNDEAVYLNEVAPGRNRAVYLLGHLVSTNDALLPLLGLGDRLFPELDEVFSKNADRAVAEIPSVSELKEKWQRVNATLIRHFNNFKPQDWLSRHTAVSAEDFAKEPHRNRLNVLIGRTNHQSYHLGQLNLLTVEEAVSK